MSVLRKRLQKVTGKVTKKSFIYRASKAFVTFVTFVTVF